MKSFEIDTMEKAIARIEQGKIYFETSSAEKTIALIKLVLKFPEDKSKYLRIAGIDIGSGWETVYITFYIWMNTSTVKKTGFYDSQTVKICYVHEEHHDLNRRKEIASEIYALLHDERLKIEKWSPTRYWASNAIPFFLDNLDKFL